MFIVEIFSNGSWRTYFLSIFFIVVLNVDMLWMCTRVYCYFYMTHVHILRGRNSISCTFVGRESHKGDVYTKREKTSFLRKPCFVLFYFMLIFLLFYDALLCLVSILYCFHRIMLMCWTCILPYVIVLYWLHVRMIICFTIWSL